ncbi:MAG: hypothetical protein ACYCOU_14050 [Sulfobacillus sp.]
MGNFASASATKENITAFWAEIFSEHMDFLRGALKDDGQLDPLVSQALSRFKRRWHNIAEDPKKSDSVPALLQETGKLQSAILGIFHAFGDRCGQDLVIHMLEEAHYFEGLFNEVPTSADEEARWWCREHAENLQFLVCQLPSLIARSRGNAKLGEELLQRAELLSGQFSSQGNVAEDIVKRTFELNEKHRVLLQDVIADLGYLVPQSKMQSAVKQMLEHELKEGDFARQRLKQLSS